jgi:hypothetical protein
MSFIGIGNTVMRCGGGIPTQVEMTDYLAGLATPLSAGQINNINQLLYEIKRDLGLTNMSDLFDVLTIDAGETSEVSLKNTVKNAHHGTLSAAMTHTTLEGFTPDGAANYINMNFKALSQGVNYTRNSAGFGYYIRTKPVNALKIPMGAVDTDPVSLFMQMYPKYLGKFGGSINSATNIEVDNFTNDKGLYAMFRDSATAVRGYINSIKVIDDVKASVTLNDLDVYAGCRNLDVSANVYTEYQIAMKFISGTMTDSQYKLFLKAFEAYMIRNSKSVVPYVETQTNRSGITPVIALVPGTDFAPIIAAVNAVFRIPLLCYTNNGTLICGAEARYGTTSDFRMSDLVIKRSLNDGVTWGAGVKVIANNDVYNADIAHGSRVMNGTFLVNGNRIYLFATKIDDETYNTYYGYTHNPALMQTYFGYKYSDDDGVTWSAFVDLNALETAETNMMSASPTNGIVLTNGTLVIPAIDHRISANTLETGTDWGIRSCLVYSTNNGVTWQRSTEIPQYTDECAIIEYLPNQIMMICRNYPYLRVFTTSDLGATWVAHATDKAYDSPDCQIAFLKYIYGGVTKYLFTQPYTGIREDVRLRVSDDFVNWGNVHQLRASASYGYTNIVSDLTGKLFTALEASDGISVWNFSSLKNDLIMNCS